AVLVEAGRGAMPSEPTPTVLADAGVENVNAQVDELISTGAQEQALAGVDERRPCPAIDLTSCRRRLRMGDENSLTKVQNVAEDSSVAVTIIDTYRRLSSRCNCRSGRWSDLASSRAVDQLVNHNHSDPTVSVPTVIGKPTRTYSRKPIRTPSAAALST